MPHLWTMIFSSEGNIGKLYGTIWKGEATYLIEEINGFLKGKKKVIIHFHTPGGSVFDGNLIFNALKNSKTRVDFIIDGIAASMGSVIILSGHKISIAENAFIMTHSPSGVVNGNAKDMVKAARLLTSLENQFIQKYASKTGKSKDDVKEWLDGDNWFDAKQAKEAGLVDEIVGEVMEDSDLTAMKNMNIAALLNDFDKTFTAKSMNKQNQKSNTNQNNNSMELNAKSREILGLGEKATDKEIDAAIARFQSMEKENSTLKAQAETDRKEKVKALLDPAIKDGRIPAAEKEQWEALAESNYELAVSSIAKLPKKDSLPTAGTKGKPVNDERADWSFTDWSRKDTKGLLKMKSENPDKYQALAEESGVKL